MKKIINGKKYDTKTSRKVAAAYANCSPRDFAYWEQKLYIKRTGEYFLYCMGGPASQYAVRCGDNSWEGGSLFIPLTEAEAKIWAEEHLDGDEFEQIFGEVEE